MTLPVAEMSTPATPTAVHRAGTSAGATNSARSITPSSSTESLPPTTTAATTTTAPKSTRSPSFPSLGSMKSGEIHTPAGINKPTMITQRGIRILIMDSPNDNNLSAYLTVLKKKHAAVVVRACEPNYKTTMLAEAGIRVEECGFDDGQSPSDEIIAKWLGLVNSIMPSHKDAPEDKEAPCIAVHCLAGLGRAPLLVAIALIDRGMTPFDAIACIRKKRRGAINSKQLTWIEEYARLKRATGCCIIC